MIWSVTQRGVQHQRKQITTENPHQLHVGHMIPENIQYLFPFTIFCCWEDCRFPLQATGRLFWEKNPPVIFLMHCQREPAGTNLRRCMDREAGQLKQLVPHTPKGLCKYGHHGKNWELQHAADKNKTHKIRHKRWLNCPTLFLPKRAPDGIGPLPQGPIQPHFLRVKANKKSEQERFFRAPDGVKGVVPYLGVELRGCLKERRGLHKTYNAILRGKNKKNLESWAYCLAVAVSG